MASKASGLYPGDVLKISGVMEFFVLWLHVHMQVPCSKQIIHGIAKTYVTGHW